MLNLNWRSWIKAFFNSKRRKPRQVSVARLRFRPQLEQLESRLAPATLTVNANADTNNRDNLLTFREALMVTQGILPVANLTKQEQAQIVGKLGVVGQPDIINFNIGNAQQTINISAALPAINKNPVIIDGTPPAGLPNQVIILDGTNAGAGVDGLTIQKDGGGSTIKQIQILNFTGNGVKIDNSAGNKIGAANKNLHTVISKNGANGILITGTDSTANKIANCYIGTDANGANAQPNSKNGVLITGGSRTNDVGIGINDPTAAYNVISGNTQNGVQIDSRCGGNRISGNYIGTDVNGAKAIPNNN